MLFKPEECYDREYKTEKEELVSHKTDISLDMIIKSFVDDLSNPTLAGNYRLDFMTDNSFSDSNMNLIWVNIDETGKPSFSLPDGIASPEAFSVRLSGLMRKPNGEYRDTMVILNKLESEHLVVEAWTWQLESNGHLTPLDFREEAIKAGGIDPEALQKFKMGWTINHPDEILLFVFEGLRLLELAADYANATHKNKFGVTMVLDRIHNSFYGSKQADGTYKLDEDNYMQVFTAFKNGAYLDKRATLTISFGKDDKFRWADKEGYLVGSGTSTKKEGWDISFDKEDAERLMEFLTKTEDEQDETVNPQEKNLPLTVPQKEFLKNLGVLNTFKNNQVILYLKTASSPLLSTVVLDKGPEDVVELPHVLDHVLETEEDVEVLVQSLADTHDRNDEPFEWRSIRWNKAHNTFTELKHGNLKAMLNLKK